MRTLTLILTGLMIASAAPAASVPRPSPDFSYAAWWRSPDQTKPVSRQDCGTRFWSNDVRPLPGPDPHLKGDTERLHGTQRAGRGVRLRSERKHQLPDVPQGACAEFRYRLHHRNSAQAPNFAPGYTTDDVVKKY